MSNFLALKQRRAAQATGKGPSSSNAAASEAASSAEVGSAPPETAAAPPKASTSPLLSYEDLPARLEIREVAGRGRGVFSKAVLTPGSTVISTSPLISVLDNHNILLRCSCCFVAAEDLTPGQKLSQCSVCHTIRYCSPTCQRSDWVAHRNECKAIVTFAKARRPEKGERPFPDTPIRALGRLLWAMERKGDELQRQVDSLQSHRSDLSDAQQEQFYQLSVSLAVYVGRTTLGAFCPSASAFFHLCSRFTSNSFSLTSPHLSNIGVSISPLVALINHSCSPNAVVVFPSFADSSNRKPMRVVAICNIEPGEELLTSYVDLGLPKHLRQAELKERYFFDCSCSLCSESGGIDPRQAFMCRSKSCSGQLPMPDPFGPRPDLMEIECSSCGTPRSLFFKDYKLDCKSATHTLKVAEELQYKNLDDATKMLAATMAKLHHEAHAPWSHPFLAVVQSLLSMLLHGQDFAAALPIAQMVWSALSVLHPDGHPTRAVALAAFAKLRIVETNSGDEERYWRDEKELQITIKTVLGALEEVRAGFGSGGRLEAELSNSMRQIEEGMTMTKAARGS